MNTIIIALITLGVIGLLAAIILYFVSQKFKIAEDPRIHMINEVLPGANCGGCGFPGCSGFAIACSKATNLKSLVCPVGGDECMQKIGSILGLEVAKVEPMVSVLLCNGTCANRKQTTKYDGSPSCRIVHDLYTGETECSYGCLGHGDCQTACQFDALYIDKETGIPVIDEDKCTACYACVKACPKMILEMRKKGPKGRRIFVACTNKDKGGIAKKACSAACIGCMKCVKECKFDAIEVKNNCAYIDFNKCKLCRKCAIVCPTGAIHEINFPPRAVSNPKFTNKEISTLVEEIKIETTILKENEIIDTQIKENPIIEQTEIPVDKTIITEVKEPICDCEIEKEVILNDSITTIQQEASSFSENITLDNEKKEPTIEENPLSLSINESIVDNVQDDEQAEINENEIQETIISVEEEIIVKKPNINTNSIDEVVENEYKPHIPLKTPIIQTTEEPKEIVEQVPSDDKKDSNGARNIDDIVNSILRESSYNTGQKENNFIILEEKEAEIDIEALLRRKKEETEIDDIFKTPIKNTNLTKDETIVEEEVNKNTPQQLELL